MSVALFLRRWQRVSGHALGKRSERFYSKLPELPNPE
jgi:hypothetical protein